MPSTQDLRRKIGSVKATGKLTRAMQMVAASKMSRATAAAQASRSYANEAWSILANLSQKSPVTHPLFADTANSALSPAEGQPTGKRVIVALTSNRGLAGGYNSQLLRLATREIDGQTAIITVGRKGLAYIRRFHTDNLLADFPASDSTPRSSEAEPIAKLLIEGFLSGAYRQVDVAYTHFVSTLTQEARLMQLLPIVPEVGDTRPVTHSSSDQAIHSPSGTGRVKEKIDVGELLIEPDPASVLAALASRIVPLRLYQAMLESSASEHSARMVAMKSATDNAKDIVDDLTLTYQSIRQANITREIIEVSAGANALSA